MKIKANTSFAGAVSMYAGEVRDVDDKTAKALISCGYAEKYNAKSDSKASEDVKQNENK
ncbi:MAG: hypothetical protein IJ035_09485 [Oscillospiraceae bacterium]|nr:hypothetical protein [Oscillospiraceae bacterium]